MMRHVDLSDNGYTVVVDRLHWDPDSVPVSLPERPPDVPFSNVRYLHTNTRACYSREDCNQLLQEIKASHVNKGLSDIKYNFMVASSGAIYVGRGWNYYPDYEEDPCAKGGCLDVAFIGKYPLGTPVLFAIHAGALSLVKLGILQNHLSPYYNIAYLKIDDAFRQQRARPRIWDEEPPNPHEPEPTVIRDKDTPAF